MRLLASPVHKCSAEDSLSPARRIVLFALLALTTSASADVVRLLDDPREAMQARVDLVQQAEHRIALMYFLARDDQVTLGVLALLRDARRRGVEDVRILRVVVGAAFEGRLDRVNDRVEDYRRLLERRKSAEQKKSEAPAKGVMPAAAGPGANFRRTGGGSIS